MEHRENRIHIGFFGRCNVGKSTLINVLSGQNTSIVSSLAGTTTDTVSKTIELPLVGPAVLLDTAGLDDKGELALKRIEKSLQVLSKVDLALIVADKNYFGDLEQELVLRCKDLKLPYLIIYNKQDLCPINETLACKVDLIVDHKTEGLREKLCELIAKTLSACDNDEPLPISSLVKKGDFVVLVCPIDSAAPKGRLILPQVKTIREIADIGAVSVVTQVSELSACLETIGEKKVRLIVTDSQVFDKVDALVPETIALTSFSILLAKEKGNFEKYLEGIRQVDSLQDGDKVLILESCTHVPTCEDIGRVKIPKMLSAYCKKKLLFEVKAGINNDFGDIGQYKLVIQCGGCVATKRQMSSRLQPFIERNIPVCNYGMIISLVKGIFQRAVSVFEK